MFAAELRQRFQDDLEILAAFGGRILPDGAAFALPHLVVAAGRDGGAKIVAHVRGTPADAAAKMAMIKSAVFQSQDVVLSYADSFQSSTNRRVSYCIATVRRREPKKLPKAA